MLNLFRENIESETTGGMRYQGTGPTLKIIQNTFQSVIRYSNNYYPGGIRETEDQMTILLYRNLREPYRGSQFLKQPGLF